MPHIDPHTLYTLMKFSWRKGRPDSECVADISYDPLNNEMIIEFKQRGTYKYSDVPLDVYADFETAGSRGQYFNNYIRPNYSAERIA